MQENRLNKLRTVVSEVSSFVGNPVKGGISYNKHGRPGNQVSALNLRMQLYSQTHQ